MKNVGTNDRLIRAFLAEVCVVCGYFWTGKDLTILLYLIAFMLLVQAATGTCGLYRILGIDTTERTRRNKKRMITVSLVLILAAGLGASYASSVLTERIFLEDFSKVNEPYRQALFNTGQGMRQESIDQYDQLATALLSFQEKYSDYRPSVIRSDDQFSGDVETAAFIVANVREDVYTGNLSRAHEGLEQVRPLFQGILKRSGLSPLAVALVDFHETMEQMIEASEEKNSALVMEIYPLADEKLGAVETLSSDPKIVAIRADLVDLRDKADAGDAEGLPAKAAELKKSYAKAYLTLG